MARTYPSIGVQVPEVFLPRAGTDLQRWAVIACDQYTSQPEYWRQVEEFVGPAPSSVNLIFPEIYLEDGNQQQRIQLIQTTMQDYLDQKILQPYEGMVYVERTVGGKIRRGLMIALDLEQYNYSKGARSLIRATEGTIIERLPPRIKIREGAPLELPHILVLVDDPQQTVIEPLAAVKGHLKPLYEVELMLGSGHLEGRLVDNRDLEAQVIQALEKLAAPHDFAKKYGLSPMESILLFAVGDGNHSLATAKAIWEKIKTQAGPNHPARFALVEVENIHDDALEFEPIHRVLFGSHRDAVLEMQKAFSGNFAFIPAENPEQMIRNVDSIKGPHQAIGVVSERGCGVIEITNSPSNLPVGTLQNFLDDFLRSGGAEKIDYVHGEQVVVSLGSQSGNLGFYLPAMPKSDLFKSVILDGALPRKTFSMGQAYEKRFYMEARKII